MYHHRSADSYAIIGLGVPGLTGNQKELFKAEPLLPNGFKYRSEFIRPDEEAALLREIEHLPFTEAKYKQYTAKRRIVSYGGTYDYSTNELLPAGPIPPFLDDLRQRVSNWLGVPPSEFTHALIAEYRPGTQLGWHRDVPDFEIVVGISLGGACRMRLRPYPPKLGRNPDVLAIELEPRSAYTMRGPARWNWQHSIPPTKVLR